MCVETKDIEHVAIKFIQPTLNRSSRLCKLSREERIHIWLHPPDNIENEILIVDWHYFITFLHAMAIKCKGRPNKLYNYLTEILFLKRRIEFESYQLQMFKRLIVSVWNWILITTYNYFVTYSTLSFIALFHSYENKIKWINYIGSWILRGYANIIYC